MSAVLHQAAFVENEDHFVLDRVLTAGQRQVHFRFGGAASEPIFPERDPVEIVGAVSILIVVKEADDYVIWSSEMLISKTALACSLWRHDYVAYRHRTVRDHAYMRSCPTRKEYGP